MAVSIAISQVSSMHVRAAERGAHQARGRNWLGFRLLYMIWMFEPVEAKDLARFAQISRQTISSALSVLEADGLITRSRSSATDRRLVQLGLTEKGRDEARESILAQNNAMTEWLHVLDEDEQDTLLRLLRRLHAHHPGEL
jgi:DNA-binding MarR family transcriptional regulator